MNYEKISKITRELAMLYGQYSGYAIDIGNTIANEPEADTEEITVHLMWENKLALQNAGLQTVKEKIALKLSELNDEL